MQESSGMTVKKTSQRTGIEPESLILKRAEWKFGRLRHLDDTDDYSVSDHRRRCTEDSPEDDARGRSEFMILLLELRDIFIFN